MENPTVTTEKVYEMRTCQRPGCNNEFQVTNKKKRYCSDACRGRDSIERNSNQATKETSMPLFPAKEIHPQAASFIIHQLQLENKRLQSLLSEEKAARKKVKQERDELREDLQALEMDRKIKEVSKPRGLGAIIQTETFKEFMPYIGPVLGRIFENITKGAGDMAGIGQHSNTTELINWIASLPVPVQDNLLLMLQTLSNYPTPDQVNAIVTRIRNLISNGTTATPTQQASATGTYQ